MLIATKPKHRALNDAAEKLNLEFRGSELDVVKKSKYLGVQVDNSLDWKTIIIQELLKMFCKEGAKNTLPSKDRVMRESLKEL